MSWLKEVTRHLLGFSVSKKIECDIEDEFSFHLKMRTTDNISAGMSPDEARAEAKRRFGDYDRIKGRCREIRVAEGKTPVKRTLKLCIWFMLGLGAAVRMISTVEQVRQIGRLAIAIALLWFLLIYVRAMCRRKATATAGIGRAFPEEFN
jgi:hypothetical protein